jgi:methylated-DNA-[protein]-cysteine S-methyltransferase
MTDQWEIATSHLGITGIRLKRRGAAPGRRVGAGAKTDPGGVDRELQAYFAGQLKSFTCRYDLAALPPFTRAVLELTAKIPYGEVRSYAWIARELGKPKAARAVGNALARNPVPIIVPCHRVVRGDGAIGGFALGSAWKKRLLDLEKKHVKPGGLSRRRA